MCFELSLNIKVPIQNVSQMYPDFDIEYNSYWI